MSKKLVNVLKFILFFGFGVVLVFIFLGKLTEEEKEATLAAVKEAKYFWISLSIVFALISHCSRAQRWRMLMEPMGFKPRFWVTFFAVMGGYLVNLVTPRLGEVFRCGILNRYDKAPIDKTIGTMAVERAIDLILMLSLMAVAFIFEFEKVMAFFNEYILDSLNSKFENTGVLAAVVLGSGALLFIIGRLILKKLGFWQKVFAFLKNIKAGLISIKDLKNVPMFIFHSVTIWVMYVSMTWICFYAFEGTSELALGFFEGLVTMVLGSFGIILVPGGVGLYQFIVTNALVDLYAVDKSTATAFSWVVWGAQTAMLVLGGFISLLALGQFQVKDCNFEKLEQTS